jgi:hypothetical protein
MCELSQFSPEFEPVIVQTDQELLKIIQHVIREVCIRAWYMHTRMIRIFSCLAEC